MALVYTLRVAHQIQPDDPAVIVVSDRHTLADLHHAIQQAFAWDADHLYSFFMSGQAWDRASEYAAIEAGSSGGASSRLTRKASFARLKLDAGATFLYLFDYGDEHHFTVQVEHVVQSDTPPDTPQIAHTPTDPPEQYGAEEWVDPDEADDQDVVDEDATPTNRAATILSELVSQLTPDDLDYQWGGDGADLHDPVRKHVETALVPSAAPYPAPLDQLLRLGDMSQTNDPHPGLAKLKFTPAHVPDLVRMVRDRDLNTAMSDTLEVWAPAHALRALSRLDITGVIADLIPVFDLDDDWNPPYLAKLLGQVGEAALKPVQSYLQDRSRWIYGRAEAANAVREAGRQHSALRDQAIQILSDILADARHESPEFNGFIVSNLLDLQAVEALPVVEQAFALDCVDEMIVGDWQTVHAQLSGSVDQEELLAALMAKRGMYPPGLPDEMEGALPPSMPSRLRSGANQKNKRKMASQSRKTNQARQKKKKKRK